MPGPGDDKVNHNQPRINRKLTYAYIWLSLISKTLTSANKNQPEIAGAAKRRAECSLLSDPTSVVEHKGMWLIVAREQTQVIVVLIFSVCYMYVYLSHDGATGK
jgi:hypothetical protein